MNPFYGISAFQFITFFNGTYSPNQFDWFYSKNYPLKETNLLNNNSSSFSYKLDSLSRVIKVVNSGTSSIPFTLTISY